VKRGLRIQLAGTAAILARIGRGEIRVTTEALPLLVPPPKVASNRGPLSERAQQISAFLERNGASFFSEISAACGGGFPGEILDGLWELVWRGENTNDTFHTVRQRLYPPAHAHADERKLAYLQARRKVATSTSRHARGPRYRADGCGCLQDSGRRVSHQ